MSTFDIVIEQSHNYIEKHDANKGGAIIKHKLSTLIRVISVPPIMVSLLVLILFVSLEPRFAAPSECLILVLFLGVIPVLAYPSQKHIPGFRESGRDGQRKLAFLFTLFGYSAAFIWSACSHSNAIIMAMTMTYFFSVIMLTICNKLLHFKASGHASCVTAPILLLVYFAGWQYLFPGIVFAIAVCLASVYLKRHTISQFIAGSAIAFLAFILAIFAERIALVKF